MGAEHQAGQRDAQNRTDRAGSPTEQQVVPAQGQARQSVPRVDEHRRSGLTVQGVLAPQRTVGNAATGRWLRAVAAGGAVSPGGAAGRVASDPFPPQIMAPADASGRVARSPARLAQRYTSTSGLAADAAMTTFARRAFEFWTNHKEASLEKLCEYLLEGVKNRLGELPGPPPTPTLAFKQGMGFFGFNNKAWEIQIDPDKLSTHEQVTRVGQLDGDEVAEIADTFWHESRHSEQHFRIARMRAEKMGQAGGEDTNTIVRQVAAELNMPPWVVTVAVEAAKTQPLTDQTELEEASGWYEFRAGKYVPYRLEVDWIRDLAWELRYWLKEKRYRTNQVVSATDHADKLYNAALAAYNDYQDEVDAFAVGGAVAKKTKALFAQAKAQPSTEKPKAVASKRQPTRDSIQTIIELIKASASGDGDDHFPAIRKMIETSLAHAFDKKVLDYIDRITKCAEPIAAFHSISREDSQVEQAAFFVEFFENLRDGALKNLKALLAGDAPERSNVQDRTRAFSVQLAELADQEKVLSVDQLDRANNVKKQFSVLDDIVTTFDEIDESPSSMAQIDMKALLERADMRAEMSEDDSDSGETIDIGTLNSLRDAADDLDRAVAAALKGDTSSASGGPTVADQGAAARSAVASGEAIKVDQGPEGAAASPTMAQPKQKPAAYGVAITTIKNRCKTLLDLMGGEPKFGEITDLLNQFALEFNTDVSSLLQISLGFTDDLDSLQAILEINRLFKAFQLASKNYISVATQTISKSGDKPIIKSWKSVQALMEALGSLSTACDSALAIDL